MDKYQDFLKSKLEELDNKEQACNGNGEILNFYNWNLSGEIFNAHNGDWVEIFENAKGCNNYDDSE